MNTMSYKLAGVMLFITVAVQAQTVRDTTLAGKAIFDVENPQFAWGVQQSPNRLSIGLTDESCIELREGNTIWYVQKTPYTEQQVATVETKGNQLVYIMGNTVESPSDTIGIYTIPEGKITDRDGTIYRIHPSGQVSGNTGNLLDIGKEVNRKLSVFFLLEHYYIEQKRNQTIIQ